MQFKNILVVALATVGVAVSAPTDPEKIEKRSNYWRVYCPNQSQRPWKGNLANYWFCRDHCGCNGKFLKVRGQCRDDRFLECYHNYCGCYNQGW